MDVPIILLIEYTLYIRMCIYVYVTNFIIDFVSFVSYVYINNNFYGSIV